MFKKFTWGHGVIVALGSFIVFILFLVLVFPNGKQNAELVSNDYYADELRYQEVIDAKTNAEKLDQKPTYAQNKQGITLAFPETALPDDSKINFELFRTNDANLDVKKELVLNGQHAVAIPAKVIVPGPYILKVKWMHNKKPYQLDYDVEWK